jgi:hypothetical protein
LVKKMKLSLRKYERQAIVLRDLVTLQQSIPRVAASLEGLGWASDSPIVDRERKLQTRRLVRLLEQERRLIREAGHERYWENSTSKKTVSRGAAVEKLRR